MEHNYREAIYNVITGEMTYRDYSAEEIAEVETAIAKAQAETKLAEDFFNAKKTIFEKLGLTEEEAAILLG